MAKTVWYEREDGVKFEVTEGSAAHDLVTGTEKGKFTRVAEPSANSGQPSAVGGQPSAAGEKSKKSSKESAAEGE